MYHRCRIIQWFLKLQSIIVCQSFSKSAIKTTYLTKKTFFFLFKRQQTCYFRDLKPYGLSLIFLCSSNSLEILRLILCSVNACESHLYPVCHSVSKTWHFSIYKHFIHLGFLSAALRLHFPQILFLLILQFHGWLSHVFSLSWRMH